MSLKLMNYYYILSNRKELLSFERLFSSLVLRLKIIKEILTLCSIAYSFY